VTTTAPAAPSRRSASSDRAARRRQRFGCETPRIFTPPLRELNDDTSLGFACIEFAEQVCGVTLYPWQKWLLIHALELAPDVTAETIWDRGPLDPIFRFRKVFLLVARQNGKTTLVQVMSLFFLYVLGIALILGTAQDLDTAEEAWEGALDIIEETPELAERAMKPIMVNGKKTIRLTTGERYKVKAANRKAGRGLSGDLVMLDELREHQSWDAWGAITKTTNARPAAMIWSMSNAGDATSVVLKHHRMRAHAALGDPDGINAAEDPDSLLPTDEQILEDLDFEPEDVDDDDPDTLGIFEWSAPPGCAVTDIEGILQANPSVGYGISIRTILDDAKNDPEWVFRTECLCQWSDGTLEGAFPPGTWEAGRPVDGEPASEIAEDSPLLFCLDVSVNRDKAHIAVAGRREDGIPHVEVIASRAGTEWVPGWFAERAGSRYKDMRVAVQTRGAPASSLIEDLEKVDGLTVVVWSGSELGNATGLLYDAVALPGRAGLRHNPQPVLDVAASVAATKYLGGGSVVWDRLKSPADIAPLVAVTGALWLLLRPQGPKKAPPPDIF
jgi:hypothetical protein